jgi:hypothetical protein
LLRRWARATLDGIGETGSLCIRVVDIEEMAELNSRYRRNRCHNVLRSRRSRCAGQRNGCSATS